MRNTCRVNIVFAPIAETQGDIAASSFERIGHNLEAIE